MGPTADEVEGNSPAEELERANSKGDEVAHQDQEQAKFRDEARRGINSVPTTGGSELPGGPSGDAAASGRTANKSGGEDDDGAGAGPLAGGGQTSGSGLIGRFNRLSKRKRTGIIGGALGGGGLLIALGFAGILQYELVQIEEKITGYFDNRLKHEIQQELPKFYRKVFAEGGKEEGDQNTGDPITDADHNFSLDTFATDADIAHVDYGPSGEVDALTTDDGERLNVDDATLDDPDSPLMSQLDGRFPGLDFFRVSYRSRILDGDWGIVRNFLASKEEPISDDPATLKSQLDQDVTAAEENTNGAPETESTDEDSAKSDLENTVSDAETNASATVGPASTVMQVCGAESIGKSINRSLWIVRVAQLLRISNGITLDTAHQEKTGDLHASQLAVMMKLFSGFAKSGGWKVLTGVKGASVSGSEKSKFAAKPSGTLANVTSAVSVTAPVCDPINSTGIFGPVLVDISELDPEEDGILTALETAIGSVVKNEIGSKVLGYLAGIATNAASKPILDVATATGADVVDATISGYDNYSNMNEEANGGEVLTPAQVADLNQEANTDDLRAAQQKGIAYQLFSPNYDNSLVSDLLLKFPTSPDDITTGLNSAIAAISAPFNKPQLAAIGSFLSARVPLAQASGSPAPLPEDPAGWEVSQAGLPTALFNAYPDPEANEQWIIKYLCSQPGEDGDQPGLYDGDCSVPAGGNSSSELTDQNDAHHDPYHDYVRECFINPNAQEVANDPNCQSGTHGTSSEPDLYDRFRVYRFDLGVANMMTSYNNTNDDQNPADTSGSTTPAPLPTSSTGYVNPLKDIQNLTPMRLDQGVDYSGTGPIYAMGPGTVDNVHAPPGSGWGPNNIYISYTLSSGPANGKTVYVAECVDPAVNPGDTLTAGQKIGTMTNCGSGIEIGWSQSSGDLPVAPDLVDCSGAPSTGLGSVQADALAVNFSSLLQSLGAPGGTYQCGQGAVHGSLPSGYPSSWQ